ncbi:MAG: hypothetical protein ACE5E3_05905 [Mariprofundus sp.]
MSPISDLGLNSSAESDSISDMQNNPQQAFEERIQALTEHLSAIRRNMEKTIADNHRMREVVRIAEHELRKRRDQVQKLESELEGLQNGRLEAKARVEHAMEQLDELISNQGEVS